MKKRLSIEKQPPPQSLTRAPRHRLWFLLQTILAFLILGVGVLYLTACYDGCGSSESSSSSLLRYRYRVETRSNNSHTLFLWVDLFPTGVYSPAMKNGLLSFARQNTDDVPRPLPPYLDELAEKGYLAVRVPHAPPNYTPSRLIPGHPWNAHAVEFTYYMPPNSSTKTTVPIPVTRATQYEDEVNRRYPIEDGRSHWEVWRLEGDHLPIPSDTFRLKDGYPPPIELMFQVDFVDAPATAAAGQPVELLLFNGYTFIGPFRIPLVIMEPSSSNNPSVVFDQGCEEQSNYLQIITPSEPVTLYHWLANYDTAPRTFTVTASSSQDWDYTYYYGAKNQPLQRAAGLPFTVTVNPGKPGWPPPPCVKIAAVYTPNIPSNSAIRETLYLTATSITDPDVQADIASVLLGPNYQLNEQPPSYPIHLPMILK